METSPTSGQKVCFGDVTFNDCVKDGEWNGAHSFNSPFGRREWLLVCETEGRMLQNS